MGQYGQVNYYMKRIFLLHYEDAVFFLAYPKKK